MGVFTATSPGIAIPITAVFTVAKVRCYISASVTSASLRANSRIRTATVAIANLSSEYDVPQALGRSAKSPAEV